MAQNFLDFMQFFGKFDKIVCWRSPRGSAPPPTGNPGSAPDIDQLIKAGADVNYRANVLLFCAAEKGTLRTIQSLLRAGIAINTSPPYVLTWYLNKPVKCRQTNVVLLLAAAGEKIDETEVEIPRYLQPKKTRLKHLCRKVVRNHLLELDPHTYLFSRVPRLGLPSLITDYLLYNMSMGDPIPDCDPDEDLST